MLYRLEEALAKKEKDFQDTITTMSKKHLSEVQKNKELFATSETSNTDLQKEVRKEHGMEELFMMSFKDARDIYIYIYVTGHRKRAHFAHNMIFQ